MEQKTPGERLRYARRSLGISLEVFGTPLDRSRTAISRWETDGAEITRLEALAIEHVYEISAAWILEGVGSMAAAPRVGDGGLIWRPLISGAASCGPGGEINDPGPQAERHPFAPSFLQQLLSDCGDGRPEDLYLVRCEGDSMRPTVFPGDLALVNTAEELRVRPKRDALHLVRPDAHSTDARVKRVRIEAQDLVMLSDAPNFTPVRVSLEAVPIQSLVLGRVCWLSRAVTNDFGGNTSW